MHSQSDSQLLITQLHVQATSHPFNQNNFAQPAQLPALLGAAQSLLVKVQGKGIPGTRVLLGGLLHPEAPKDDSSQHAEVGMSTGCFHSICAEHSCQLLSSARCLFFGS